jgi:hypothetical protein
MKAKFDPPSGCLSRGRSPNDESADAISLYIQFPAILGSMPEAKVARFDATDGAAIPRDRTFVIKVGCPMKR